VRESEYRRESLKAKLIPYIKRNSKHSGSSTMNTNQLESKALSSPYMQQVLNRGLSSINNFASNGKQNFHQKFKQFLKNFHISPLIFIDFNFVLKQEKLLDTSTWLMKKINKEVESEKLELGIEEGNINMLQKQHSAPIAFINSQKHSSFQDNLQMPIEIQSIQEHEMEDTIRSASPNLDLRSNKSRLAHWRTQK